LQKIPTIFERDWNGDRSRVVDKPHADCAWVFAGEGLPMRKYDGTCCAVMSGRLYKRRELRPGETTPSGFMVAGHDDETGKTVGWLPIGDGPEDRWHREAFNKGGVEERDWRDGTYELLGPKVQGNPEQQYSHNLISHASAQSFGGVPTDFDGLKAWLAEQDIEGLVWHHPDGRMAKIKLRDFGLKRKPR
jgi:hypothetical protein